MKISIVTATFNSAATLADTFESVLRQKIPAGISIEHIVKDGGSSDSTMDIVLSMKNRYQERFGENSLRWITGSDNGIYDAMNQGIKMATGDIVGVLNSDDFFTSDDVLDAVARNIFETAGNICHLPTDRIAGETGEMYNDTDVTKIPVDAVYGDVHYVDEADLNRCVRYYSSKGFRRWKMRCGYMPAHPSFYCRRAIYSRFGLFDTSFRIAADFEQLLRFIYVNRITIRYIPKDFVTMRTGGASSSGLKSHRRIIREHIAAYRKNNIASGWLHECIRYTCKGSALIWHRLSDKLFR